MPQPPLVLIFSGLDPTGGAGIQADIEAIAAQGAHAATLVTALTVQDTQDVMGVEPVAAPFLRAQLETLLRDVRVAAIKIGLLGAASQIAVIERAIDESDAPVVLDPVLHAGGGAELADETLRRALLERLVPRARVVTPNGAEARRLAPHAKTLDDCGATLLARGAAHVLITGGDEPGDPSVNTWYAPGAPPRRFEWPRLPGPFHGAGCTLASAIAARLALGDDIATALARAQAYTHEALKRARRIGRGRAVPSRLP